MKKVKLPSITIDPQLLQRIEARAELENRNFSNMVETMLIKAETVADEHISKSL